MRGRRHYVGGKWSYTYAFMPAACRMDGVPSVTIVGSHILILMPSIGHILNAPSLPFLQFDIVNAVLGGVIK